MKKLALYAVCVAVATFPVLAQDEAKEVYPSPGEIVAAAKAEEWVPIPPADLMVMDLAKDRDGKSRRVVIQLMPAPFNQGWVSNIRKLVAARWYDGVSVNRVQDNYVVQWGDPDGDNPEATGKAKPLPKGLKVMGGDEYTLNQDDGAEFNPYKRYLKSADFGDIDPDFGGVARVSSDPNATESDYDNAISALMDKIGIKPRDQLTASERVAMISIAPTQTPDAPEGWHQRDSVAEWVEIWEGWPIANKQVSRWLDKQGNEVPYPKLLDHEARARGFSEEVDESVFWPVHCYGMVGVGRNLSPDTGSGAELYAVIGHAPRHLDRNIALVGRVIEGMEHLSSLPRGKGDLGFYAAEEADKRTSILTVRLASELADDEQASFEFLDTKSIRFALYAKARANRRDPFFNIPAGGADICNIPVPVRRKP